MCCIRVDITVKMYTTKLEGVYYEDVGHVPLKGDGSSSKACLLDLPRQGDMLTCMAC